MLESRSVVKLRLSAVVPSKVIADGGPHTPLDCIGLARIVIPTGAIQSTMDSAALCAIPQSVKKNIFQSSPQESSELMTDFRAASQSNLSSELEPVLKSIGGPCRAIKIWHTQQTCPHLTTVLVEQSFTAVSVQQQKHCSGGKKNNLGVFFFLFQSLLTRSTK